MPFITTEPQRIEGTRLGYAVYSYQFSFQDHLTFEKKYDRKLMIFKLKDTAFVEVEKVVFEDKYCFNDVKNSYIDEVLKSFICQNAHHIVDIEKMDNYFKKSSNYNLIGKTSDVRAK